MPLKADDITERFFWRDGDTYVAWDAVGLEDARKNSRKFIHGTQKGCYRIRYGASLEEMQQHLGCWTCVIDVPRMI